MSSYDLGHACGLKHAGLKSVAIKWCIYVHYSQPAVTTKNNNDKRTKNK